MRSANDERYIPDFPGSVLGDLVDTCILDLRTYGYFVDSNIRAGVVLDILRLTRLRITEEADIRRQIFEKFAT